MPVISLLAASRKRRVENRRTATQGMDLMQKLFRCCPTMFGRWSRRRGSSDSDTDSFVPFRSKPPTNGAGEAMTDENGRIPTASCAAGNKPGSLGYGSCINPVALATEDEAPLSRDSSVKSAGKRAGSSEPSQVRTAGSSVSSGGGLPESPEQAWPEFKDHGLGQLHFALQYMGPKSTLYIRIIKGVGLTAQDSNGLSDPYVKIHLLPDTGRRTKLRTRTQQRTLSPIWDEEFCYSGVLPADLDAKNVRFTVLDEDTIGSDWMGELAMPLKHLVHGKREYCEIYLQPKDVELEKALTTSADDRGKIHLGLYYAPAKCELTVKVIQCANLIAMDPNGYSDPFVKLYLKPDPDKSSKFKTSVKKKTLNPEFDEDFVYNVSPQELPHKTLEITVWDQDIGTKNDFIGALMLGNKCSGARWLHWEILLKQPYQSHDRWHPLSAELTPSD